MSAIKPMFTINSDGTVEGTEVWWTDGENKIKLVVDAFRITDYVSSAIVRMQVCGVLDPESTLPDEWKGKEVVGTLDGFELADG